VVEPVEVSAMKAVTGRHGQQEFQGLPELVVPAPVRVPEER